MELAVAVRPHCSALLLLYNYNSSFPDSLSADPVMKQAVSAESGAVQQPQLSRASAVILLFAGIITLSTSSFRLF